MAKRKKSKPGYGKILDAWGAPEGAGDPIGCVATSFTFKADFFEEECLARFLKLETDPTEDGPLYLVEREEKLSQVTCAAAMVDQHHCRGSRNLRWDLLPARLPRGILHAKISVLHWTRWLRIIVASANLTEDGYRRNQEVFGVLDYHEDAKTPLDPLREIVGFLRSASRYAGGFSREPSPAIGRWHRLLDAAVAIPSNWGVRQDEKRRAVRVHAVVTGSEEGDAFAQIENRWPSQNPPHYACVTSPFFDPPDQENEPAKKLWRILKLRGQASIDFYVSGEDVPDEENQIFVHAPKSLADAEPRGRNNVSTRFYRVNPEENRALHAKTLWLENERWVAHMIGSSNFTSAGFGLPGRGNLEANLLYVVDTKSDPRTYKALRATLLDGERLQPSNILWQPAEEDQEDEAQDQVALPPFFESATFDHDERIGGQIEFRFTASAPPGWSITADGMKESFVTESMWRDHGAKTSLTVSWPEDRPPSGFEVRWEGSPATAWWPVNIRSMSALPPPEELKNLPFEVLLDILTSARPLYKALRAYLKRKKAAGDDAGIAAHLDPHKRVDTSAFLLQRTRRVSWALCALRERLSRPVSTDACLQWRLRGPVGVVALAEALQREAKSEAERTFLTAELALELARVVPRPAPGCLSADHIRAEFRKVTHDLRDLVPNTLPPDVANLQSYVEHVFEEIAK